MKITHFSRSLFIRSANTLFKNTIFVFFVLTSGFVSKSPAQCLVDAGRNKTIRSPEYAQLYARPQLKSSWKEHPKTTINSYMDACFLTDTSMIVVGTNGAILKFSNEKWNVVNTNVTTSINAVDFYDDKNGLAVGSNDVILKTTDGGNTWNQISSATGYIFSSIQYINAQTIYMVGYKSQAGAPIKSGFFKSIDGGNNWELISEISGFRIASIDFINSSDGFACGSNKGIFKTTDGGNNWQQLSLDIIPTASTFDQIKAASANVVYAVGYQGRIIKSIDGGDTWMDISPMYVNLLSFNDTLINTQPAMFKSIVCFSPNHITVAGFLSSHRICWIMTSYDGGEIWNEEKVIVGVKPRIIKMDKNTSGEIIATGDDGIILSKSSDDKFEWSPATGLSETSIPNPMAAPNITTTYTVKRTSGACIATDEVTVFVANFSNKYKTINCGNAVQLDSVSYPNNFKGSVRYKWTPATGLDHDTIARPICTASEDTRYTCKVTLNDGHNFNNSVYIDSVFVFVNTFEANAGEDIQTVSGSNVELAVTHNYTGHENVSYKWYPADGLDDDTKQNPIATVSGNITYTVAVTTASGCVAYDDVNITAKVFQPENFSRNIQLSCGSSVKLDSIKTNYSGSGRLSYKWSPATGLNNDTIASPVCSASTNITYKVTITTPAGISTTSNVFLEVYPLQINTGSNKSFYCGEQVQLDSVTTNYSGTGLLRYKWTPSTGLSNDTIPNPVVTSEETRTYTITISTTGGCSTSKTVNVTKLAVPTPSITGVSVDAQSKNLIIWETPAFEYDSMYIYKETSQLNQYIKIGSAEKGINAFSDTLSQPKVMSNAYKISLLDPCGTETVLSSRHKTMHLAINKGVGNSWNLIWEPYVGFEVSTYYIYRGTSANQLSLISSLSGANTQFSDFTAPVGDIFYQIEAVKSGASNISSSFEKVKNQTFTSRSNIAVYLANVGVSNPVDISNNIELYPNPAHDYMEVLTKVFNGTRLILTIYNLQGLALKKAEIISSKQHIDISGLAPGMYMVVIEDSQTRGSRKLVVK